MCLGAGDGHAIELDNFMAADETFSSTQALQDAIAEDVEQRIATAHLRAVPSKPATSRPSVVQVAPGKLCTPCMFGCLDAVKATEPCITCSHDEAGALHAEEHFLMSQSCHEGSKHLNPMKFARRPHTMFVHDAFVQS